jgi:hypothetical protein
MRRTILWAAPMPWTHAALTHLLSARRPGTGCPSCDGLACSSPGEAPLGDPFDSGWHYAEFR